LKAPQASEEEDSSGASKRSRLDPREKVATEESDLESRRGDEGP